MPLEIREDPVCGMAVAPGTSVGKSQFGEWLYHFCSERCKEDFDRDPVKYLLRK